MDDPITASQDPIVKSTRPLQTSAVEPQRGSFPYREWRKRRKGKEGDGAPASAPGRDSETAPAFSSEPASGPALASSPHPIPNAVPRRRRRRSILAIVIATVVFVLIASTFASVGEDLIDGIFGADSGSASHQTAEERDQAYASGLLADRLEHFKNADDTAVEELAAVLDTSFTDTTGATLADCDVDPHELARTMLEGFDYSIEYTGVYEGEDTGHVSANVDCRQWYQTMLSTTNKVEAFEGDPAPADVGATLMEAAKDAPVDRDQYISVDIVRVDGTWTIDEESWAEELEWLFWL